MSSSIQEKLGPLRRQIGGLWMIGWTVCVLSLGLLAVVLKRNLDSQDLDSQLSIYATATYGLSWFDEGGAFHGELLQQDSEIMEAPFDIWIVAPGKPEQVYWQSPKLRYPRPDLQALAEQTLAEDASFADDARTLPQYNLRLQTALVFQDGEEQVARAAVLVIGSNAKLSVFEDRFVLRLGSYCLLLLVAGFIIGMVLSRRSLAPVMDAMEDRERFLSAAAHELRTPLATLSALAESGAKDALPRVHQLAKGTAKIVDQLLLFAQLDSGTASLKRERLRLDLLADAHLPENCSVEILGGEVEAEVDAGLFGTLFDNLFRNAVHHGKGSAGGLRLELQPDSIVLEDDGPGFPQHVLHQAAEGQTFVASQGGVGLGLTLLRMIVELHGGEILLGNRSEGGAHIEIRGFAGSLR